jgi:hypothetical protein
MEQDNEPVDGQFMEQDHESISSELHSMWRHLNRDDSISIDGDDGSSHPLEPVITVNPENEEESPPTLDMSHLCVSRDMMVVKPLIVEGLGINDLTALIDTGAAGSLMTAQTYNRLPKDKFPLPSSKIQQVKGVGNAIVPILGVCTASLMFWDFVTQPIEFLVVSDGLIDYDLICGVDMLR